MAGRDSLAQALGAQYRLEREPGRGGFATVFLAHDLRHDRPVALKVLHPEVAASLGADRCASTSWRASTIALSI